MFSLYGIIQQAPHKSNDSVSLSATSLYFNNDGTPKTTDQITVTSSSSWSLTFIDTGYGTSWIYGNPTSEASGHSTTLYVFSNPNATIRTCKARFTVGTATADCFISQDAGGGGGQ